MTLKPGKTVLVDFTVTEWRLRTGWLRNGVAGSGTASRSWDGKGR